MSAAVMEMSVLEQMWLCGFFWTESLSGLLHPILIQEQVYQCWARRPQQLISSSPLSDELAMDVAWLWGKVGNCSKAFQPPRPIVCFFLLVFVPAQHFISSHASDNKHTSTQTTPKWQNNFGSGRLSIKLKHLQGFEIRMRTLGNYSIPSAENKANKKGQTCTIRLYTDTHIFRDTKSDTHTQTHTHGHPRGKKLSVKTKK